MDTQTIIEKEKAFKQDVDDFVRETLGLIPFTFNIVNNRLCLYWLAKPKELPPECFEQLMHHFSKESDFIATCFSYTMGVYKICITNKTLASSGWKLYINFGAFEHLCKFMQDFKCKVTIDPYLLGAIDGINEIKNMEDKNA